MEITTKFKENNQMSKSASSKLESARKWLEKNGQASATGKAAQAALASAEKSSAEAAALKARHAELLEQKKHALLALDEALLKAKTEKRLKEKDLRLQAKIAALSSAPGAK